MIDYRKIITQNALRANEIHWTFLTNRQQSLEQLSDLLSLQISSVDSDHALVNSNFQVTTPLVKVTPLFDEYHLREFASGSLTSCFGPEFAIYDGRRFPRVPNGEFALLSRIMKIEGQKGKFHSPAFIESEYDVPLSPWYIEKNSSKEIPYSFYMEIALQPCGFLSAYLGSPMILPEKDFFFRNLDGEGKLLARMDERGKTIVTRAKLLSTLVSGDTIIQHFEFELWCDNQVIFEGKATFGYFSPEAMRKQAGLDSGRRVQPFFIADAELAKVDSTNGLNGGTNRQVFIPEKSESRRYRIPEGHLELLDDIHFLQEGGRHVQGYIYARKRIDPQDWFFRCHFFQDPVMPGSLGVEAMLQALQAYVIHYDLGKNILTPKFSLPDMTDLTWRYRGQIVPANKWMQLEVHISGIDETSEGIILKADASLWADELRIYEVKGLSIGLTDTHPF